MGGATLPCSQKYDHVLIGRIINELTTPLEIFFGSYFAAIKPQQVPYLNIFLRQDPLTKEWKSLRVYTQLPTGASQQIGEYSPSGTTPALNLKVTDKGLIKTKG